MSYLENPSVEIEKVANGWKIELTWEEKKEADKEYMNEEWFYPTWEEAVKKAAEFFKEKAK